MNGADPMPENFEFPMPAVLSDVIGSGTQYKIAHRIKPTLLSSRDLRFYMSFRLLPVLLLFMTLLGCFPRALALESTPPLPGLDGAISILPDPTSSLTLSDVLASKTQLQFEHVRGSNINFGFRKTAVWIRLILHGTADTQAILSLTPNFLDDVDIYTSQPGAAHEADDFSRHQMGDHRPLPQDGISGLDYAVRLSFAERMPTEVYIRILNTSTVTDLNLKLGSVEERGRQAAATASIYGVWLGGMSALFITQFIFFYFDRKAQYLLLAFSTLGIILIYMGNLGYSRVYLFPDNGAANDVFLGFNSWGGLAASALAYSSILDLRNKAPLLHRVYQLTALVGLVGVGFAFASRNILFGPVGSVFGIIMSVVNMVEGLRRMNEEGAASRLRAAAFTALCLGASLTLTHHLGVVWMPDWTAHSYGVSGLVLTMLLTGSLAVRLRAAEALNNRMREDALSAAQAAEQVAHRLVAERTRELVTARQIAEDALRAEKQSQLQQVRFLEVISHQYRTPLAAISSSIDSLGLAIAPEDGANHGRIERIRRAIARLVEMLEINLARSRLQGPSFRPHIVRVSAGSVVSSAFQRARDLLNGPAIRLAVDPRAATTSIMADAGMLELAIINLLENAVKYTLPKGDASVDLSLTTQGTDIVIDVTDRGIGIPAGDLPRVFASAIRGSNAESVEGSGMGLFLVEKIAKAHDGRIEVDSVEGEGTTVRVILQAMT